MRVFLFMLLLLTTTKVVCFKEIMYKIYFVSFVLEDIPLIANNLFSILFLLKVNVKLSIFKSEKKTLQFMSEINIYFLFHKHLKEFEV